MSHNATSSKSLPPPLPPPVHDDEVSRSLAALIPETLPVLSEVLGPQSAKNLLLSPEYYRQLLHTLTTTDLSPTVRYGYHSPYISFFFLCTVRRAPTGQSTTQ